VPGARAGRRRVRHALAAGDAAWAAELVEQSFWSLLWRSEDTAVPRWLAALPAGLVHSRPRLCVALASRAAMGGRLEEAERLLAAAERAHGGHAGPPGEPPAGAPASLADDVPTLVAMLRANLARTYGDAEPATRFAKRVLAGQAGDDPMARAAADWNLAQADWLGGRLAQAFEPGVARAGPRPERDQATVPGPTGLLSDRELQVPQLLAAGRSNAEIAEELVVVLDTAKKHVSHILDKLGAANRTQAVARARALGLLP
jgi:ATP/maltotriose-dependent transcriptional regulator MalT